MAARITQLIREATGGNRAPRGALTRFAEAIPTTTSTVSRWRGGTIPDPAAWPLIATALGITLAEVEAACDQPAAPVDNIGPRLDSLEAKVSEVLDALGQRDVKFDALAAGIEANHTLLSKMVPILRALKAASPKPPSAGSARPSEHKRTSGHRDSRSGGAHTPPRGVRRG